MPTKRKPGSRSTTQMLSSTFHHAIYYARLRIKGKLIWRSCRRGAQLTVSGEDAGIWGGESIGLPFAVELEKFPRETRLGRGGPN